LQGQLYRTFIFTIRMKVGAVMAVRTCWNATGCTR